jgi:putative Holliday junction resolvase
MTKIMAIDYGDAHTGIAVSDPTGTLAGFTTVIHSRREEQVVAEICRLAAEHGAQELVMGYPKNMDGTLGPRAEKCAALAEVLRRETGLQVVLWDERRSTVEAHDILLRNGKNGKKRKKIVDAVAASLMLEGYLTRRRWEAQS